MEEIPSIVGMKTPAIYSCTTWMWSNVTETQPSTLQYRRCLRLSYCYLVRVCPCSLLQRYSELISAFYWLWFFSGPIWRCGMDSSWKRQSHTECCLGIHGVHSEESFGNKWSLDYICWSCGWQCGKTRWTNCCTSPENRQLLLSVISLIHISLFDDQVNLYKLVYRNLQNFAVLSQNPFWFWRIPRVYLCWLKLHMAN